ncbi:MAG: hypothetical protein JWN79_1815 [Gemmatimonadetes bacterium]|nr:hypothetical protein [Gemmatimonadota bacterium]
MRKLMLGLLLASAACSSTTTTNQPMATSTLPRTGPRPALDAFLSAVRAQDLQAMAAAWGDKDGAVRDSKRLGRDEVERRELIMMCYFKHDQYRVLSEQPAAAGERVLNVQLTKGTLSRSTNFYMVNAGDRWYVRTADMDPVADLCKSKP